MAANWWKYGLCVFGGLGIGYLAGVKITKNKAEEECESRINDIREIYRNNKRASSPKSDKKKEEKLEKPEVTTKTSIQMDKLSERKEKAEEAKRKYGKAFEQPTIEPNDEEKEDTDSPPKEWKDYIHIVDEFPEDCEFPDQVLDYYADGVLAYDVTGQKVPENEIPHLIGENTLDRLDSDDCNEVLVVNDLYRLKYTIIFRYQEYAEVTAAEPYKAEL